MRTTAVTFAIASARRTRCHRTSWIRCGSGTWQTRVSHFCLIDDHVTRLDGANQRCLVFDRDASTDGNLFDIDIDSISGCIICETCCTAGKSHTNRSRSKFKFRWQSVDHVDVKSIARSAIAKRNRERSNISRVTGGWRRGLIDVVDQRFGDLDGDRIAVTNTYVSVLRKEGIVENDAVFVTGVVQHQSVELNDSEFRIQIVVSVHDASKLEEDIGSTTKVIDVRVGAGR